MKRRTLANASGLTTGALVITVAASGRKPGTPAGTQLDPLSLVPLTESPIIRLSCRGVTDSAGQPSQPLDSDWP